MGQLDKLHKEEIHLLTAIVVLSLSLPEKFTSYTGAIGEIRRKLLRSDGTQVRPGRTLPSRTRGYVDGHKIRASKEEW